MPALVDDLSKHIKSPCSRARTSSSHSTDRQRLLRVFLPQEPPSRLPLVQLRVMLASVGRSHCEGFHARGALRRRQRARQIDCKRCGAQRARGVLGILTPHCVQRHRRGWVWGGGRGAPGSFGNTRPANKRFLRHRGGGGGSEAAAAGRHSRCVSVAFV